MFSALPALLSRNFMISFYLPSAFFLSGSYYIFSSVFGVGYISSVFEQNTAAGTALIVVVTWVFAIILMSLNNLIIMYFEGYYPSAMPFYSALLKNKLKHFNDKTNEKSNLFNERANHSQGAVCQPFDLEKKLIHISRELAEPFPDRASRVLPTKFGNAIRAFESYPGIVYGVDAIGFWPRIYLLLSQQIREAVAECLIKHFFTIVKRSRNSEKMAMN